MRRPFYGRLPDLKLGGRARTNAEMDLEIESHIAMRVADLVRAGRDPDDAREEAMRRFVVDGSFDDARRRLHAAARQRDASLRQRDRFTSIVADLRYAARQARLAPAFAALAISALAIGIGATTTIFTLLDHVLLRPLPFTHAEQLVQLTGQDSARNSAQAISSADWLDLRRATRTMRGSAIYSTPYRQALLTTDSATRVEALRVSGNYFDVLGARFVVGRPFTEQDAQQRELVAVISERLWRRMFGGDAGFSAPLRLPVRTLRIVGVVADGQDFPAGTDVWLPVPVEHEAGFARNNINWRAIGRLRDRATVEQANAELSAAAQAIHAADPLARYDFGIGVERLGDAIVGDAAQYLALLMGVVALVLLIVCANVAAAGLARGSARAREMAIRTSLGAGRGRLVQQLLIEHAWLGLLGGALGLLLAWVSVRAVLARWGGAIPRAAEVTLDGRVFLFALVASLTAGVLAGVIPALRITRVSLSAMLASRGRAATGGRNPAGAWLVSTEIALALLLLTGAGLLIRSFRAVVGRDIGFDTNVATAEIALAGPRYSGDSVRRYAYWSSLIDSYRAIPGVEAAAVANWIPLGMTGQSFVDIADHDAPGAGAVYRTVSDEFFRALKMPLLAGRSFDRRDGSSTPRVALINRRMATAYWPGEDPIGKRLRASSMERGPSGQPAPWVTVIGIVGDVRTYGLETDARPEMYMLYRQTSSWTYGMTALVRGNVPAVQLLRAMRQRGHDIDPHVPVDVGTLSDRLRTTLSSRALTMSLLTAFAGLALVLAALGVYGVLSYAVAQRGRELAVRAALGASRGGLLWLVLGSGLRVVGIGLAVGTAAAFWLSSALGSMLVDVRAADPASYAAALLVLSCVSFAAILVPAVRATRLDPVVALQAE